MTEVSHAGKDHGHTVFIAGGNNFRVVARTAGLNNGFDSGFGSFVDAIAKREEGIGCDHSTMAAASCFVGGNE